MIRRVLVGVLAVMLVLAPLAGIVPALAGVPTASASSASLGQPGYVTVPSDNVHNRIPDHAREKIPVQASDLEGRVQTDAHSRTLNVTLTTRSKARGRSQAACRGTTPTPPPFCESPEFALQLSDDKFHDGRRVAVPVDVLEDALGRVPKMARGRHESGEHWTSEIRVEDGRAIFRVPRFSTNTVTFSGQVEITATPASDGSKYTYDLSDLDAADNYSINVTGHLATQRDLDSGTASNGGAVSVSIAGTTSPVGPDGTGDPELSFVGVESATWNNQSASGLEPGSSSSISVGGNVAPDGPQNGDPALKVTAHRETQSKGEVFGVEGEKVVYHNYTNPPEHVEFVNISAREDSTSDGDNTVEIWVDGTKVWSDTQHWFGGNSRSFNPVIDTSVSNKISIKVIAQWTAVIESSTVATPLPSGVTANADDGTSTSVGSFSSEGATKTVAFPISQSATSVSLSSSTVTGTLDYTLKKQDVTATENPAVDVDGDGVNDVSHTGVLRSGETATYTTSAVSLSTSSLDVATASGTDVSVELNYTERTETIDPTVEVNGHTTSYSGTLSDGSTTTLSTDTTWLQEGTNTVNVSVGDGTLSADAPTPSVALDYSHDAVDNQSVDYAAERWSERYNVSKSFASDQSGVSLTIPFRETVYALRDVEIQTNGGSWSDVAASDYSLDGTELTVQVGSVSAGDSVAIRANGSKVRVNNATITVVDATPVGSSLDSKIRLDSWDSTSYILVPSESQIHYTYDESWSADESVEIDASGDQRLDLPNAAAGSTMRVSTIPVEATPVAGDVEITVDDATTTEPSFHVSPGSTPDDAVTYTLVGATDGETYVLWSETNEVVRDSGTANSPLSLEDDDSEETLAFLLDDSSTSTGPSSTGDSGGGAVASVAAPISEVPVAPLLLLVGVPAVLAGLYLFSQRFGDGDITTRQVVIAAAAIDAVIAIQTLSPAAFGAAIQDALSRVFPLLVVGGLALAFLWLRNRGGPETVNRLVFSSDGEK